MFSIPGGWSQLGAAPPHHSTGYHTYELCRKKTGRRSEGDSLELEGGGRGSVLQIRVCAIAWEPVSSSSPHVHSRTLSCWVLVLSVQFSLSCFIFSNSPPLLDNFLSSFPPV